MKLRNRFKFTSKRLRQIIRFCCPPGVTDFLIRFEPSWGYQGIASGKKYAQFIKGKQPRARAATCRQEVDTECPDVVIGIPDFTEGRGKIEKRTKGDSGYLPNVLYTPEDVVVHIWWKDTPTGRIYLFTEKSLKEKAIIPYSLSLNA
jgi:hypothetical protein